MSQPIGIFGGGGFGQALATAVARQGQPVLLWSRSSRQFDSTRIEVTQSYAAMGQCRLIFVAVPSEHVGSSAKALGVFLDGSHFLVHVSRGLASDPSCITAPTLTELLRRETPCRRVGVLAGPLIATALRDAVPGAGIVGSRFGEVVLAVREAIAGPTFRIYETADVIGVEVASAMVGLLALVFGYARALGLGPATLAVLGTRGLAEAARIGATLGADPNTFFGLAGAGDLMAAMIGDDRPEVRLGHALGSGTTLEGAANVSHVHIEGIAIANQVAAYARRVGMAAPISDTLARVLANELSAQEAVEALMALDVRTE